MTYKLFCHTTVIIRFYILLELFCFSTSKAEQKVVWGAWQMDIPRDIARQIENLAKNSGRTDLSSHTSLLAKIGECYIMKASSAGLPALSMKLPAQYLTECEWPYAKTDLSWSRVDTILKMRDYRMFEKMFGVAPTLAVGHRPNGVDFIPGCKLNSDLRTLYVYRFWNGKEGKNCQLAVVIVVATPHINDVIQVTYRIGHLAKD